jgi:hypothetical protein
MTGLGLPDTIAAAAELGVDEIYCKSACPAFGP